MDWQPRRGLLQGQIQTKEPLETSLFASVKRKRARFCMFSATWLWKSQQRSRKSIYTPILLSPELRGAPVQESPKSPSVWWLAEQESRVPVLCSIQRLYRKEAQDVWDGSMPIADSCQESIFEFPWQKKLTSHRVKHMEYFQWRAGVSPCPWGAKFPVISHWILVYKMSAQRHTYSAPDFY